MMVTCVQEVEKQQKKKKLEDRAAAARARAEARAAQHAEFRAARIQRAKEMLQVPIHELGLLLVIAAKSNL